MPKQSKPAIKHMSDPVGPEKNENPGHTAASYQRDSLPHKEVNIWQSELGEHTNKQALSAQYIHDMLGQLHDLADDADLVFLGYLIDMARQESALHKRCLNK